MKICCICGKQFEGWGNNPAPIKNEGECCDDCNMSVVLVARLRGLQKVVAEEVNPIIKGKSK